MADININFGTEDLDGLRKLIAELQKAIETLRKGVQETGVITKETTEQAAKYTNAQKAASTEINKRLKAIKAEEGSVLDLTQKYKLLKKEIDATAKPTTGQVENLRRVKSQLDAAKKSTNEWGVALNSFQFKFNALGNVAGVVFDRMLSGISRTIKEFISFNKIINSTQTSGDGFAITVGDIKARFDALSKALATGNFSNIFQFMSDAAQAARDYVAALDVLEDRQNSVNILNAESEKIIASNKNKIKETEKFTLNERIAFTEQIFAEEKKILANNQAVADAQLNALTTNNEKFLKLTRAEQLKFLGEYEQRLPQMTAISQKINAEQQIMAIEAKKAASEQQATTSSSLGTLSTLNVVTSQNTESLTKYQKELEDANKELSKYNDSLEMEELFKRANIFSDEERLKLTSAVVNQVKVETDNMIGLWRVTGAYNKQLIELRKTQEKAKVTGIKSVVSEDVDLSGLPDVTDLFSPEPKTLEERLKESSKIWERFVDDEFKAWKRAEDEKEKTEKEKAEIKKAIQQQSFDTAFQFTNLLAERNHSAMELELAQTGLSEEQKLQIKRKYARKDQAIAVAESVIGAAQAVVAVWAKWAANPVVAAVLTGLSLAATGLQIATIKAQKFAKGGEIGGHSHEQGGTIIEAERGEFVVKKSAYQKNKELVNAINAEDGYKIAVAMRQDKGQSKQGKDYTKELYNLLKDQETGYETPEFYVIRKGNTTTRLHK